MPFWSPMAISFPKVSISDIQSRSTSGHMTVEGRLFIYPENNSLWSLPVVYHS